MTTCVRQNTKSSACEDQMTFLRNMDLHLRRAHFIIISFGRMEITRGTQAESDPWPPPICRSPRIKSRFAFIRGHVRVETLILIVRMLSRRLLVTVALRRSD